MARAMSRILPHENIDEEVLARVFRHAGIEERYLALPIEDYADLGGLERRNERFVEVALDLGERAIRGALDDAGLAADQIGEVVTTCTTGLAVPSLEARLMNRIEFAADARRVPLFGLGCAGGAAGLARVADFLRGFPDQAALLLSVELCSLTFQKEDASTANIIGTGLFGDAAAAVLLVGPEHPLARGASGPAVLATRSAFFADTERIMGWDVVDTGFKLVLSPEIPTLAREQLPELVDSFLTEEGLGLDDIDVWVPHPGGPKVLDAVEESLELEHDAIEPARRNLAEVGNVSSASVLILLDQYRRDLRPPPGSRGLLFAFGPAFCAEILLLEW